jgi:aldose 1-epimerase
MKECLGVEIKEYRIKNDYLEASFLNLGAIITKLVDLKTGVNVIVGHHDRETYRTNPGYMNAVIGRHSGRIQDFELDGHHYTVTKNASELFQLHGGFNGFNVKFFDVTEGEGFITFRTTSEHLEEGYPGKVEFSITYRLVENELHLEYQAVSTDKTILSFTNHAYFNLSGKAENTILNHELMINADDYIELDQHMIPIKRSSLKNTPLDLSQKKRIGLDMHADFNQMTLAKGFDHPYLINKTSIINHVATLYSPESNLSLEIYSDQDVVVLYTGNFINDSFLLNDGVTGGANYALCLETQGVPNSINISGFEDKNIYEANEVYRQKTIWKIHPNK